MKAVRQMPPRKLFLLDALGASITTLLLATVLTTFEAYFGMPRNVLCVLAALAALLALYSFWNASRKNHNWQPFMKGLAIANWSYCSLTMALVFIYLPQLTWLGISYFALEALLVIGLATVEWTLPS